MRDSVGTSVPVARPCTSLCQQLSTLGRLTWRSRLVPIQVITEQSTSLQTLLILLDSRSGKASIAKYNHQENCCFFRLGQNLESWTTDKTVAFNVLASSTTTHLRSIFREGMIGDAVLIGNHLAIIEIWICSCFHMHICTTSPFLIEAMASTCARLRWFCHKMQGYRIQQNTNNSGDIAKVLLVSSILFVSR